VKNAIATVIVVSSMSVSDAQVLVYECDTFPEKANPPWTRDLRPHPAARWLDNGQLFQHAEMALEGKILVPEDDVYRFDLIGVAGTPAFFAEWCVETDADAALGAVAPIAFSLSGFLGVLYHTTTGVDLSRLIRDSSLPIEYTYFTQSSSHIYRLEHFGADWFRYFVDNVEIASGIPEGYYPTPDSQIAFHGRAAAGPTTVQWDYIRFGVIPDDHSGDFDSSGTVTLFDFRYFDECRANSGPDTNAGPGCRWADMDADADVDLHDFGAFQVAFTGD